MRVSQLLNTLLFTQQEEEEQEVGVSELFNTLLFTQQEEEEQEVGVSELFNTHQMEYTDVINITIFLNVLTYLYSIIFTDTSSVLIKKYGYCITSSPNNNNNNMMLMSTHTSCCIINILFFIMMVILTRRYSKRISNDFYSSMTMILPVVVFHSINHFFLSYYEDIDIEISEKLTYTPSQLFYLEYSFVTFFIVIDVVVVVWGVMIYGMVVIDRQDLVDQQQHGYQFEQDLDDDENDDKDDVADQQRQQDNDQQDIKKNLDTIIFSSSVIFSLFQCFLIPLKYNTTFIYIILMLCNSIFGLLFVKKTNYYKVRVVCLHLPMCLFCWIESMGCDYIVVVGGHLLFDILLILCLLVYFLILFVVDVVDDDHVVKNIINNMFQLEYKEKKS